MGRFLITWDDRNNVSTHLDTAVCSLLMTSANSSEKCRFALRKPLFNQLNYGDDDLEIINGLNGDGQDSLRYAAIS